jgi:hypothetical protein
VTVELATTAPRTRQVLDVAAAIAIAAWAPTQRTAYVHQGYGIRAVAVAVVGVAAVLALALDGERRSARRALVVALAAGAFGAVAGGRFVGVWLVLSVLLAGWTVFGIDAPALGRFPRRALPPVVVVAVLAGFGARREASLPRAFLPYALVIVLAIGLSRFPELPRHAVALVARVLRAVLALVLLVPLWVVAVLLPWAVRGLVRYDPFRPLAADSSWIARLDVPVEPGQLWFADPARRRPPLRRRVHAKMPLVAGLLMALVVVAAWVVTTSVLPALDPGPRNEAERILRDRPGFDSLHEATNDAISRIWFSQYVGNEWSNYESEFVNIADGRRRTWRPSGCSGDELLVWMFGGSTLFGMYHDDDHTIPSELARAAAAEGLNLRVENWGVPGDVAWQESRRLQRALASGVRPDVVVFYDGWNDLRSVADMDFTGREGASPDFIGPLDRVQERVLGDLDGLEPGDRRLVTAPDLKPGRSAPQVVDLAAASYADAHRSAEMQADADDIAFFHFYQPSLHTRREPVAGEPDAYPGSTDLVDRFRERLPEGVSDLGAAFDDVDAPLFYDEVHTTERGNAEIAASMLETLRGELAARADLAEADSCR